MKIAIRYYTKTGNTQKLAEAIAEAVGVEALDISSPLTENVDILFLGSSVYAAGADPSVKEFINAIDVKIGMVYNFSTAALLPSTYKQIKKLVTAKGIAISEKEYHCCGSFKSIHRGKPDADDCAEAAKFALSAAKS